MPICLSCGDLKFEKDLVASGLPSDQRHVCLKCAVIIRKQIIKEAAQKTQINKQKNLGRRVKNYSQDIGWLKGVRKYLSEEEKRDVYLRFTYHITLDHFKIMMEFQEIKCAICKTKFQEDGSDAHVDRDHGTGEVRGLLCPDCNKGIGLLKDKVSNLINAIDYYASTPFRQIFDRSEQLIRH